VKVVKLPPPLVGAPKTAVQVFLFFYAHEGEDWTVTAIAKEIGCARPNTHNTISELCDTGLIARRGRWVLLGESLKEETFWVDVPECLVGRKLSLIQAHSWLSRLASTEMPFDIKLQDLSDQFGYTRAQASKRLKTLCELGLIEYSAKCGHGNGITVLSVQ
tara:strand:- start:229 stop:711 length:483 start_codon:yes stop_codon:yes gene_type:complete